MLGRLVKVFTEVSDGQDDVRTEWTEGKVVGFFDKNHITRERGGIIVNVPDCAYRDKNIRISDDLISRVVR